MVRSVPKKRRQITFFEKPSVRPRMTIETEHRSSGQVLNQSASYWMNGVFLAPQIGKKSDIKRFHFPKA